MQQFRWWLEKLPVAAYVCDAEGLITYFNPPAAALWGRTPQLNDPTNRYCGAFRLWSARGEAISLDQCWMARALAEGCEYTGREVVIEREDGSRTTVLANINPIHSSEGRLAGAVNLLIDISERQKIEEALRNSEARYSNLVNNLDGIVWEVDARTMQFRFVSQQAERILGYPVEMWVEDPKFWPEHIHPDDREWAIDYCNQETKRGAGHTFEYRMLATDGSIVWLRDYVSVEMEEGEPKTLRGMMVDISDYKLAEQQLRESEEKFATVFRNAPIPFAISEVPDGTMVDFNEAGLRLSECSSEEVIGRTSREIGWISDEERERLKTAVQTEGRFESEEVRFITKSGRKIHTQTSGEMVTIGGKPRLLTAIMDVTARRVAEETLKFQNQMLEMVATDAPLTEILGELIRRVEQVEPEMKTSVMLYDPSGKRLMSAVGPSLPQEYVKTIDGLAIGEGVGSCGTAAWRRRTVIVEDVERDPLWKNYRQLGERYGFRACWSAPILDHEGELLGTFASYFEEPKRPSIEQEELIHQSTQIAAIAINSWRREQALHERQTHLVASQRISNVGSWELDLTNRSNLDANPLRWTEEVFRILGYKPDRDRVSNEAFWARVPAEDRPKIERAMRDTIDKGLEYEVEHRISREDGTERVVQERGELISDLATGKPRKIIGTIQDVTDQREAEGAITRHVEHLTAAVAWTDEFNRVEYMNRNMIELFGYEPAELPSMEVWFEKAYPDPSYREEVMQLWVPQLERARKDGGMIGPVEVNITCRDGTIRFVSVSARIVGTRQVVTFNDLTERKLVEDALITSEARSRAILEALPDLMFVMDADGVIRNYHASEREDLYVAPELFMGRRMEEFLPDTAAALFMSHRRNLHASGRPQVFEYELDIPTKGKAWFEARMAVSGERESITLVRNITARLKLEEQLRQSQKMDAVGRLAGGISHDFNNLLTVIIGYTELVLSSLPDDSPHREALMQVMSTGESAAALTKRLLAFSRQQLLNPQAINLNELVGRAEIMVRRLIGSNILVIIDLKPLPLQIRVDPVQIEQVLMNLAINARDAMPDGGELRISTRAVEIPAISEEGQPVPTAGHYTVLSVSDSGHGMTPEIREKIFEPFFTTKGPEKGTGLGLPTVHGIVTQSGGHITVESEPGRGTKFELYFPALKEESTGSGTWKAIPGAGSSSGGTLLTVEDDPSLRSFLRQVLHARGYRVMEAANGKRALDILKTHASEIDLVITDLMMPEMSGSQLLKNVRVQYPELQFLLMSGYPDDTVVRENIAKRAVEFLPKPFTAKELTFKVEELLARKISKR